jgi:hypothetical protein
MRHISVGSGWRRRISTGGRLISHPPLPVLLAAIVSGAFIIYRHRDNL